MKTRYYIPLHSSACLCGRLTRYVALLEALLLTGSTGGYVAYVSFHTVLGPGQPGRFYQSAFKSKHTCSTGGYLWVWRPSWIRYQVSARCEAGRYNHSKPLLNHHTCSPALYTLGPVLLR